MSKASIDPVADIETIETELMLADLDSPGEARRQHSPRRPRATTRTRRKLARSRATARWNCCATASRRGCSSARRRKRSAFRGLGLLTSKPVRLRLQRRGRLGDRTAMRSRRRCSSARRRRATRRLWSFRPRSRAEIATFCHAEERKEFLDALGLAEAGLDRLIRAGYELLNLLTYFTVGPKEARAWTITQAARKRAGGGGRHPHRFREGLHPLRNHRLCRLCRQQRRSRRQDAGKFRLEGKEYVVEDGDVMHFRFNT
jgi:ribosome-binding ATPase YchF (GTP1/OBG family)